MPWIYSREYIFVYKIPTAMPAGARSLLTVFNRRAATPGDPSRKFKLQRVYNLWPELSCCRGGVPECITPVSRDQSVSVLVRRRRWRWQVRICPCPSTATFTGAAGAFFPCRRQSYIRLISSNLEKKRPGWTHGSWVQDTLHIPCTIVSNIADLFRHTSCHAIESPL